MKILSFILLYSASALAGSPGGVSGLKSLAVPEPEASPMVEVTSRPQVAKPPQPKTQKGKRLREKEAEGSEAADRFQADTVIKSQYQLNGQPLEVDPD